MIRLAVPSGQCWGGLSQKCFARIGALLKVARGVGCGRELGVASANQAGELGMEETNLHASLNVTPDCLKELNPEQTSNLNIDKTTLGSLVTSSTILVKESETKQSPKLLTLVIVEKDGKVLLGMKKRGFGTGYYNGFGGKVEPGETVDEAAVRELQEESGVVPVSMEKRGILTFRFDDIPQPWEVHVYHVSEYVGEPYETEEMAPCWFSFADIPYEKMWQDDPLWYPEFLQGNYFKGEFQFHNTHTLVSHTLHIVPMLDENLK